MEYVIKFSFTKKYARETNSMPAIAAGLTSGPPVGDGSGAAAAHASTARSTLRQQGWRAALNTAWQENSKILFHDLHNIEKPMALKF